MRIERDLPWGTIWIVTALASVVAIATSGMDTSYAAGWPQNILLGIAISSLVIYTGTGMRGGPAAVTRPIVRLLEHPFLCKLGRFSYSTYLIQFPILRLAIALTALATTSTLVLGALGFFVYAPLTFLIAYGFHVRFERPFQTRRL
jgi:peptidoglycan/LPS O-acetylase OafA/YrhL